MDEKKDEVLNEGFNNKTEKYESHPETRAELRIDEEFMERRKKKLVNFFKSRQIWVVGILIIALILGIYIRSLPMTDHGNGNPGLWDITTNTWTLGPDLDPWLFERYAKTIIESGSLPKIDMMRNVPLGFDTSTESMLLPYMIDWTYHALNLVRINNGVVYAAVIFPVIMFALTIITFFLFVREVFIRKNDEKTFARANIIASISTFFMIVIPVFLSRTVAGIPEKESAAFFFMFLAFYLFLKSWKSENFKLIMLFAVLSGISTGAMALIWGGVLYVFIPISGAGMIAFILNKIDIKEFSAYGLWMIFSFAIMLVFSNKYSLTGLATSLSSGSACILFFILAVHFLIWKTSVSKIKFFRETKIPSNILSLILSVILLVVIVSVLFGPGFIIEKAKVIHQTMFRPTTGRWNITVAENRQPYFNEWGGSFGPFVKNIPVLFWLFFIGSVVLFKKMLKNIKNKDAWILTLCYIIFFFGLVFSRYAPHPNVMDGEGFLSKALYYGSALLLAGYFIYYYSLYYKKRDKSFEKIDYEYLLLFTLFILALFTARGAVRLIMVLGPIAVIFVGFLIFESIEWFRKSKDETWKTILGAFVIIILVASIFTFWNFYQSVKSEAYNFVPTSYNVQWQKAMEWVRDETPEDSVFSHWWDYGYWLQSIGNRATVLDGGNAISYWNYLMGRLVLTGDNQDDALEFLYNHNASHLLIDSTDIGKYTAFSSIGSNERYDRYSWIGVFLLDESQTQETNNQTVYVYPGGVALDEDLIIEQDGKEIMLPAQSAGVGAILIPKVNTELGEIFGQPYILIVYQSKQYKVNLRYLYVDGQFADYKTGIEATAYIFPRLDSASGGLTKNPIGAAMFLSPRLMRGMLAQIYILDDPLDNFPNFKLVHTESSLLTDDLRNQGLELPEFVYYGTIQGPIKIWEIEYTGKEQIKQEYLDTDYSKYISWQL